jgi:hypothetical protein
VVFDGRDSFAGTQWIFFCVFFVVLVGVPNPGLLILGKLGREELQRLIRTLVGFTEEPSFVA